ncbi:hypothetical protein C8R47DRAFT_967399 [Mycena vitilis]|nr:hypothetical protein C8R47DRAFT_967399 [Mycena vitilis]
MLAFQLLSALSSAAVLVSSAPLVPRACSTASATMDLPSGQTALVSPTTAPLFVLLGVGVQNYSCSSTSTYASIGAVASLFDISCLDSSPDFASLQTTAFNDWNSAPAGASPNAVGGQVGAPDLLGFHYFVTSPSGTGISPEWDLTASGGATVLGAKVGDIAAPTSPATNVDWLALDNAQGTLAQKIFRIDTVGGQPPTSCVAGSDPISVKYTAKYYLY